MKDIHNAIYKTIDKIVEQRLKEYDVDLTYKGVVVKATSSNKYKVNINGDEFNCYSLNDFKYNAGDVVYVLVPRKIWHDKVILGKA